MTSPIRRRAAEHARAAWASQESAIRSAFYEQAAASGMPRGLHWKMCEWPGPTRFVREAESDRIAAFSGIIVHFEAIEGDGMEDVPAVALPRDATAVFLFNRGAWTTAGRTLFNMDPDDAVQRLRDQFEPIEE